MHRALIVALLLGCAHDPVVVPVASEVEVVDRLPRLRKLPVGAVEPSGWLRRQLELQAAGFSGHLPEISGFLVKEGNAWLSPDGQGARGWEEVPYWLKGFGDTGYLLGDKRIIDEARVWIEGAIKSQAPDGYFGPRGKGAASTVGSTEGKYDLWSNMVMLFALQSYYEYSGDERVLTLMTRYFQWELGVPDEDFLPPYWQHVRGGDNLWSVLWLHDRTGEPWLLELADKIERRTARWVDGVIDWHNVNIAQGFDTPGIYSLRSKDPAHLAAAERNWRAVRELYGQVPGGMFGADENARPGFDDPRQAIETCGAVEEMLSDEQMLAVSGDPVWADRCEDVAFNTLPATMTADLKALRYLTAPNMVLSDRGNKSPGIQNGGPMFHMNPHDHRCCQHNVAHGWPYFAEHLFMESPGGGLAAAIYAPGSVKAKVGADGAAVTIVSETRYPFEERVLLRVSAAEPVRFPLYLRVPGWCDRAAVAINGKPAEAAARPRSWLKIERTWSDGDTAALDLPMEVRVRRWPKNRDSVSVDRGPLTYSLRIGEKYVRAGGTDAWPAWEIHPETPWNYGLVLDGFEVVTRPWPADEQPFGVDAAPLQIRTKARRIPAWKADSLGLVGRLHPGPIRSEEPVETVTLIPMGSARLRIASFPTIGAGPDAREWGPAGGVTASASHTWTNDTVEAMVDGLVPKDSGDHSIPRFTWWDHRGTTEWVQVEFAKPRAVSAVEVYWFDDTGRGQCRVPASWKLFARDGADWKPVAAPAFGVEKDAFNVATFDPVTTTALRIEAVLRPEASAGILEWRVR